MDKARVHFLFRLSFVVLIIWYVGACAAHYWHQRPLWNDEVAVLSSIEVFKPADFFKEPLRMVQVFPHFYLFCIQSFAQHFDNSILSLRFFSFVCMLGAFAVWLKVAKYELKDPLEYLTFLLCWTASVPLIYYSAELKQYSMDVLVSGLFLLFLYAQNRLAADPKSLKYMAILALLPVSVMFSYPAYFFLMFPLWNLCRAVQADRGQWKFFLVYLASLLVFVALSYQFDVRLRPVEAVTNGFNDYFISLRSFSEFFQTFGEGINNLCSRWFVELPKVFRKIARVFMFFGLVYLFVAFFRGIRQSGWKFDSLSMVALVVFLELTVAGILHKYPFGVPRTALFFCPILLILTIQGIRSVKGLNPYAYYAIHGSFLAYLFIVALGILNIVLTQPLIAIPAIWS